MIIKEYVIEELPRIKENFSELKTKYKQTSKDLPNFYEEVVNEYIDVVKRQIINECSLIYGMSYETIDLELDSVNLKTLFWDT